MANEREKKCSCSEGKQADDSSTSEYGIEHLMKPDDEAFEDARNKGQYRFSEDQLEHKEDRIDEEEDVGTV